MDAIEQFWRLCDEAIDAAKRGNWLNAADIEPACLQLLQLIQTHPERRSDFERTFCQLWTKQKVYAADILSFCMHTLRWPVVRQFMEEERQAALVVKPHDSRFIQAEHVLESFSDDWEDTDLYPYYDKSAA
jgi:hypothetical protein